jgi:hypothetical protein
MATISRTGIAGGSTISPTHITNIIDALDGTSTTTTVIASGSFSGSLTGNATSATTATSAATASYVLQAVSSSFATSATTATSATSASYALSASYAANVPSTSSYALTALSSSYAVTASYALNAGGGGSSFPYTGSAIISGSLRVTGSLNVSGPAIIAGTTTVTGSINIDQTGGKTNTLNGTINGNAKLILDLSDVGKSPGTGQFTIPNQSTSAPAAGTMYWDDATSTLYIYKVTEPAGWVSNTFS